MTDSWYDDAACQGRSWMFENLDHDHPLATDMTYPERWNMTRANHTEARTLCSVCPVRAECLDSAEPADTEYTIRAGIGPMLGVSLNAERMSWAETAPGCEHWHPKSAWQCDGCLYNARKKFNAALAQSSSMV